MKAEDVARVCHAANREIQKIFEQKVSPSWDNEREDIKLSVLDGVRNVVENDLVPQESHERWVQFKLHEGWEWGPEKDVKTRTHPNLVAYEELPDEEKLKDKVFVAIVDALTTEEIEMDRGANIVETMIDNFLTKIYPNEEREKIERTENLIKPTPGRIVWYQTDGRNGLDYYLPAMVTVTRDSHPGDYPDGKPNSLPVPSSDLHVHLTVTTPGGFGSDYMTEEGGRRPERFVPGSGTYVEHDVPFDPDGGRRTWRWPEKSS